MFWPLWTGAQPPRPHSSFAVNGKRGLYPPELCVLKTLRMKHGISKKNLQNPKETLDFHPPPPLDPPAHAAGFGSRGQYRGHILRV